jgi:hypothetical protein
MNPELLVLACPADGGRSVQQVEGDRRHDRPRVHEQEDREDPGVPIAKFNFISQY